MNFNPPLIKVGFVGTHGSILDIILLLDALSLSVNSPSRIHYKGFWYG
jgi:hypothetical protein